LEILSTLSEIFSSGGLRAFLVGFAVGLPGLFIFVSLSSPRSEKESDGKHSIGMARQVFFSFGFRLTVGVVALTALLAGLYLPPSTEPLPAQIPQTSSGGSEQVNVATEMKPLSETDLDAFILFDVSITPTPENELLFVPIIRDADGSRYAQFGYGFIGPSRPKDRSNFSLSKRENDGSYPMFGYIEVYELNEEQKSELPRQSFSQLQSFIGDLVPIARGKECVINVDPTLSVDCPI